eukprot:3935026-Amphidinium_carterae.1
MECSGTWTSYTSSCCFANPVASVYEVVSGCMLRLMSCFVFRYVTAYSIVRVSDSLGETCVLIASTALSCVQAQLPLEVQLEWLGGSLSLSLGCAIQEQIEHPWTLRCAATARQEDCNHSAFHEYQSHRREGGTCCRSAHLYSRAPKLVNRFFRRLAVLSHRCLRRANRM